MGKMEQLAVGTEVEGEEDSAENFGGVQGGQGRGESGEVG